VLRSKVRVQAAVAVVAAVVRWPAADVAVRRKTSRLIRTTRFHFDLDLTKVCLARISIV
jgi:hypothetical protein